MLTVYGRKERSTDSLLNELCPNHNKTDVQIYHDKDCQKPFGRFRWDLSNKPTFRNKYITLNCYRWKLEWVKEV